MRNINCFYTKCIDATEFHTLQHLYQPFIRYEEKIYLKQGYLTNHKQETVTSMTFMIMYKSPGINYMDT